MIRRPLWLPALTAAALLAGCRGERGGSPGEAARQAGQAGGTTTLTGAGSTFDYPIFARWFADYAAAHAVRVNYQSIGSGGGIRQFTEGTVDFGASDAPMTDEELARAPGTLNLPVILGSVAVTYNLPGVTQPLRLTGDVLADIFLGGIRKWNDPRLVGLNPGVALPARDILVVHRSDGSGTTYIVSDYLAAVRPAWKQKVGVGKSLSWPTGLGAKGNEGVTGQVEQMEGAIGYVEQAYAEQNGLPMARLRNAAGQFLAPTVEATTAAAGALDEQLRAHPDFRLSIVNAPGAAAYPIASWSYVLVRPHMDDCARARALVGVFEWSLEQGDAAARRLQYAPLPDNVQDRVLARLRAVTCGPERRPVGG